MQESKPIYFLSGLGADKRMFAKLRLPEGYHAVHLVWFRPERHETMQQYAQRIADRIPDEDIILVGLSFGGMMAQEVARIKRVSKLILISTLHSRKEIALHYRIGIFFRLQYLFGKWMLVFPKFISHYLFSITTPAGKKLLDAILDDMDPVFLKWAIRNAAKWNPGPLGIPYYRIHGSRDRVLPMKNIKPDKVIDGGHLVVMTHAREVSEAVGDQLPVL